MPRSLLLPLALAACADPAEGLRPAALADAPIEEAVEPGAPRSVLGLASTPLVAGERATLTASGARAGETVHFARALALGNGPCPAQLGGLCLDLQPATAALLGSVVADGTGTARLNLNVPRGAAGLEVAVQAVVARGASSAKSDALALPVATGAAALAAGDLVVTEILQNPAAVDDTLGEWFEVLNASGGWVDLRGLEVSDLGIDAFTVPTSVLVAPGERVVFGREDDPALNGGVAVDVVLTNLSLANADDELVLSGGGTVIDEVAWDDGRTFPDPTGASMSLDPASATAAANDLGAAWCAATTSFGAGDEGTPGQANPSCGAPPPTDLDGDGSSAPADCDDGDPAVHPGAAEVCDGLDDDCSGLPGPTEVDQDGDGLLDCLGSDCAAAGYDGAAGLAGNALKSALEALTAAQTCSSYDAARDFLFATLDNEGGQVECVYTGQRVAVSGGPPDPNTMNTEHTWPRSWGADRPPQECDLHHLFPTMSSVNSARGNLPFGEVVTVTATYAGGSKLGDDTSGTRVFEPRDAHKGNAARAMLYMATRYGYTLTASELSLYQAWHALDPVDADELDRTWDIAAEQALTNPYVVCPQYVDAL